MDFKPYWLGLIFFPQTTEWNSLVALLISAELDTIITAELDTYHISSVIRQSFFLPKQSQRSRSTLYLDPS